MGRELEPPEFGFKPKSRRNSKRFAPETFYALKFFPLFYARDTVFLLHNEKSICN
jgi:hypothetical protein